jgi:DNA-binding transcriptional LysR family regulator
MRNVTLHRLRVFEAVARLHSVSGAARELHLTQPAVSMQVKQLEEQVGLPLTERNGRRIQLTEAGQEVALHARRFDEQLREAEAALDALKGLRGGRLSIGVVSTAKYFAPRLLAEYQRLHPEIDLKLAVANRLEIVRLLADNAIDLAIMGTPPQQFECEAERIAEHPLAWLAAPAHPLATLRRVEPVRLPGERLLVREPGSGTRSAMDRYLRAHRLQPAQMLEMSSNETIKQAVMAEMGIAFLSLHTAGLELAAGRLVRLRVPDTPVLRQWFAVHRSDKRLLPAATAFRSFLLRNGARLIDAQMEAAQPVVRAARR